MVGSADFPSSSRARATLGSATYDVLEALEAFASDRGRTMVDLAIAWVLTNPLVGSVIVGATKPAQVQANAGADRSRGRCGPIYNPIHDLQRNCG